MTVPRIRSSRLWVAPLLGAAVACVLAVAALLADARLDWDGRPPQPLFAGTGDAAQTLLSVIAMATTTLLALVFTILAVIIQLGSSQYSPRVLRTLFQDFPSHFTIGVFVATITYALLILLASGPEEAEAHGIAVTLAFGLAVLAIVTFAIYANHIAHTVRISSIINRIASETRRLIEREFTAPSGSKAPALPDLPSRRETIRSSEWGIVVDIDEEALVKDAVRLGVVVVMKAGIGEQVHEDGILMEVHGGGHADLSALVEHVEIDEERQLRRDVGWGFRILADIATRSVSTGINDATTATQALDRIHDLLRVLARRSLATGRTSDSHGNVRLIAPAPDWEHFLSIGSDEIRRDGAGSIQVLRRLREMLVDLAAVAPDERREPVVRRLELLEAMIRESVETGHDRKLTERIQADAQRGATEQVDRRSGGAVHAGTAGGGD